MLVTVVPPSIYSHLMEQPLEAILKMLKLTKNNCLIPASIYREEATTEQEYNLTQIRVILQLWIGQPGPSTHGWITYTST